MAGYNKDNISRAIKSCIDSLQNDLYDYYNFRISIKHEEKLLNRIEVEQVKIEILFEKLNSMEDKEDAVQPFYTLS